MTRSILFIVLLILLSAFFSGSEISYASASEVKLRKAAELFFLLQAFHLFQHIEIVYQLPEADTSLKQVYHDMPQLIDRIELRRRNSNVRLRLREPDIM